MVPNDDHPVNHGVGDFRESAIRQPSWDLSDHEAEDDQDDNDRSYSSRVEEFMGKEDDETESLNDTSDDEETFVYDGVDAHEVSGNYRDQLRDVLEAEHDEDEVSEDEIERSLFRREVSDRVEIEDPATGSLDGDGVENHALATSIIAPSPPSTPPRLGSPGINDSPSRSARPPFLHPSISRLRSATPQSPHTLSASSVGTSPSHVFDSVSPSRSHFSSMSRTSSLSNIRLGGQSSPPKDQSQPQRDRDVFKWTQLRNISHHIFASQSSRSSPAGVSWPGFPTVLAANGLICVGTKDGMTYVYDFKQTLKCVCGTDSSVGPVSALALSYDHTYVASGHTSGHIQLFDLNKPQVAARSVAPPSLTAVASGRKEGHLLGSRIVSIGFVAERHTAIVSADEHGLAFYHSLGKVLFVEAPDILRILGKYPKEALESVSPGTSQKRSVPTTPSRGRKTRYTVLAMTPLPLGTEPHPTDAYNIIALLTPAKLVMVGLKPTPKTWFKRSREGAEEGTSWARSKWKGTLAWFPSVTEKAKPVNGAGKLNADESTGSTTPMLAYSWGATLHFVSVSLSKVKQMIPNSRTGKMKEVEVGSIVVEDKGKWVSEDIILAMQRLNANQLVVLTSTTLGVYDVRLSKLVECVSFDALSLISPSLSPKANGTTPSDSVDDVGHSMRIYKGKIFLLGREDVLVGTLLTWADRILSYVQDGDFLQAVDLSRSYYLGEAPGNNNGLPDDSHLRKDLVGGRMRDLMAASARYAFSEDRMTDGTHVTPNGSGVDRTPLFENLVSTCARACVALDDYEFLFEDLFQQYDDAGISRIFLLQLQPFVLDSSIRYVPPRITQRLVALFEEDGDLDLAERIIWHIDPGCLDINQAIRLCQAHQLYDALIYVYTRALRDYVSPVVELLGLVRRVQQYRKCRTESAKPADDATIEPIILNAYKIFPYLSNTLTGLAYPSEEALEPEEAFQAKKDVYAFIFFGRSSVWPVGDGGKLILTSDEEGGVEPTYPYARLLLHFDAESFLNSLDIAFEDPYHNDKSREVGRLVIVKILLEILSSGDMSANDRTFINIFIARNVPKYIQFIEIAPSALHGILIGLAEDPDRSTREDRQLAAEYLLSVYNPHESGRILRLFEKAGFFRILRSWHRRERRWAPLLATYLHDHHLHPSELFSSADDVLNSSKRANKGVLPQELFATVEDAVPLLLRAGVASTALLIDEHIPELHEKALQSLGPDADHERFIYLRSLLSPQSDPEEPMHPSKHPRPSLKVAKHLRHLFISLQCRYSPSEVVDVLKHLPPEFLDWDQVSVIFEENEVFNAVIWAANWRGHPRDALSKAVAFERRLTLRIVDILSRPDKIVTPEAAESVRGGVEALEGVGRSTIAVCLERSQDSSFTEVSLEDIWFQLLSSQIKSVQSVSGCCSVEALSGSMNDIFDDETVRLEWSTLSTLRSLVQETFGSLLSISSTHAVSFPRLFKRLVDPSTHAQISTGTPYKEFRTILAGMLESYRTDGDMLIITKHLVDRDLFDSIEHHSQERARGWPALDASCTYCRKPLLGIQLATSDGAVRENGADNNDIQIVISRTGYIFHSTCSPP